MAKNYTTLNEIIAKGEGLTEEQAELLYSLLSSHCREKTKNRLWTRLSRHSSFIHEVGIFDRVHFEMWVDRLTVSYCASQSFPDEIREVRKQILEF